ncbi:polyprenol phosphomannose-dependent alpha 1,6 mannosyltransferase MptB [Hamadaea tsunoensis]|uniref:polyprenol phosphomannose-dependent alpha 1,6 mannosyltransferase MptB n=1 Tax=Hamadaea tsunoensis TaxID=53368 RepID=UPI000402EA56|nr:polyprenol phosphomannose-dependent alpha 1,6 mannosyltransferase MptB [Hamadaea tsunoensis]
MSIRLRYAVFAATLALAGSAYLAGALVSGDPAPTLRTDGLGSTSTAFRIGLLLWFLAGAALAFFWWRRGRTRAAILLGPLWAVPLWFAPPLASRDVYAYACQGAIWLDGRDPYSTGVADGGCAWVSSVPELWWHNPAPYGPLAIAVSGAAVALARAVTSDQAAQLAVALAALRLAAAAGLGLVVWGAVRLARDARGALWLGVASPLVAVHVISGAHNDALMAGLVVAGLAVARSTTTRPTVLRALGAGALVAAACAVKITALPVLAFALLLLPYWRLRLISAVGALAAFAGLTAATGLGFGWLAALRGTGELQQWTSIPTGVGMAVGYLLRALGHPGAMSACVTTARALGFAAIAVIGLYALRRAWFGPPRLIVAACGWVLLALALLGPVFYPWYALTALAVLACAVSSWARPLALLVVVLTFLVLPNGLGIAVLTKGPGAFLDLAIVIGLAVWAVRSAAAGSRAPA